MKLKVGSVLVVLLLVGGSVASAQSPFYHPPLPAKGKEEFDLIGFCKRLKGRLIDHTGNHGLDNRIWSPSLHQWRDLYIYLPPKHDRNQAYPVIYYLHPFTFDERSLLWFIPTIDAAIAEGRFPPVIIVAPDGSLDGRGTLKQPGSFFLNSNAGPYEDFILNDVWDFVCQRYRIRHERCAHVLFGASMGGFSAYNIGIRHRDAFGVVVGLHPPLNLRWSDVDGNPRAKFDPRRWGWRMGYDTPHEVAANYAGIAKIRMGDLIWPVFGEGGEALYNIANNSPLELAMKCCLRNGDLSMFVGYAGRDEFNVDAQVESFLYWAKSRQISIAVAFEPDGHHDFHTALKMLPSALHWLAPQLIPYAPPCLPPPQPLKHMGNAH
jgi:S-formylglutathione hydrolase FrmB